MKKDRFGKLAALTQGAAIVGIGVASLAGCATTDAPVQAPSSAPADPSAAAMQTSKMNAPGTPADPAAAAPAASGMPSGFRTPAQLNAVRPADGGAYTPSMGGGSTP
jgi:hypothetical protein